MTIKTKIQILLDRNYVEIPSTSKKFRCFKHKDTYEFYWIGIKKGNIRWGKEYKITGSVSVPFIFNR